MNQMWHVRGSQCPFPYAIFITKILENFGVPLEGETIVALNLRESKVDIVVFHKKGFVIDLVTRQTYKHRIDRQPTLTDEPEPTAAPNQPESHAQSFASAVMPTNQMIMDELVSLRGYITTRMDAFDTQSHQIHYELHRLSLRLSNMDVDEDNSEPEHGFGEDTNIRKRRKEEDRQRLSKIKLQDLESKSLGISCASRVLHVAFGGQEGFLGFSHGRDLARLGEGESVDTRGSSLEKERQI
ncbi:hypothetical protein Lal_00030114 [Lupinus albus]|nr:hypothetical protein Lal_00030114 [Lupinus albus]